MAEIVLFNCGTESPEVKGVEFLQSLTPELDEEFDHEVWNSILFTLVCYADRHGVEFADKQLPWAEVITEA